MEGAAFSGHVVPDLGSGLRRLDLCLHGRGDKYSDGGRGIRIMSHPKRYFVAYVAIEIGWGGRATKDGLQGRLLFIGGLGSEIFLH